MKRVVITGIGVISPLGNTVSAFWNKCASGKSGAGPITLFDASRFKTHFACEVKEFDPLNYGMERGEVRKYDRFTQFAVAASSQAIADAGIDFHAWSDTDRNETGVIWASGNGGISTFEEQLREFHSGDGSPRFNPFFIPKIIADIAAGVISIKNGLRGPNYCTVSACASSNTAIINAFDTIRLGKAICMIAGGSEAPITASSVGGFNASKALSQNNEHPEKASRPFDCNRDGFVIGEGAGALVLEELEHALQRGATIHAEIIGGGMAADAYHLTGTAPDGIGAVLGMQRALKDAGISAENVDYINAHATSTPVGDPSELAAIRQVFGTLPVHISATKSMTGHLLGAAGAIESIACVQALKHDLIPPTINLDEPEEAFADLHLVANTARKKTVNIALNNTFGFGGHTATTIFKKYF